MFLNYDTGTLWTCMFKPIHMHFVYAPQPIGICHNNGKAAALLASSAAPFIWLIHRKKKWLVRQCFVWPCVNYAKPLVATHKAYMENYSLYLFACRIETVCLGILTFCRFSIWYCRPYCGVIKMPWWPIEYTFCMTKITCAGIPSNLGCKCNSSGKTSLSKKANPTNWQCQHVIKFV